MNSYLHEGRILFVIMAVIVTFFWIFPYQQIIDVISGNHFNLEISSEFKNYTQFETVKIENIKDEVNNAKVTLASDVQLDKVSTSCENGIFSSGIGYDIVITFDKMPANYDCSVIFKTTSDNSIFYADIIADESSKYEWTQVNETQSQWQKWYFLEGAVGAVAIIIALLKTWPKEGPFVDEISPIMQNTNKSLREKFGSEFGDIDDMIWMEIQNGKMSASEIAAATSLSRNEVKKRLRLMAKKDLIKLSQT